MSELVSKYPTAGGIYWLAGKLGGPVWGWFTGWFNLVGLVGVVASVDYACATFLNACSASTTSTSSHQLRATPSTSSARRSLLFAMILRRTRSINIFRTHLLALINNISVWWHVVGVAVIIGILVFVPDDHQSVDFVFTERINNSGFNDGDAGGMFFWFYILPLGFLLTQYTITGFDASAHISEETHDASTARRAASGSRSSTRR